jgi:hypothetical protein
MRPLGFLLCAIAAHAAKSPRTEVWMMPPGTDNAKALRELFTRPEEWAETRKAITVIGCTGNHLKHFTDDELRRWLPRLEQWGLRLGLEVGAVKEWGPTGQKTFDAERQQWDRIRALGGRIDALAMDEPLCCARQHLKKPDAYAISETANFVELVRKHYPEVRLGDIEPYPYFQREELVGFIDALQAELKTRGVRGLDFFRLDVDWNHFTVGNRIYPGNWPDVKKLELACRQRRIPFSLVYWAADYGRMKQLGKADDATWYVGVMRQGYDYAFVDGKPDEFVIESWVGAPASTLPDSGEWTFTRSVRDFTQRFVPSP